ncbi:type VII toxin-antitoxin system MntA family adenylyltransferase antitoxin [Psychrobacillus glaciei]|nr:nucleotidyltransferase domain-containing protein [Psychrobacillus glaciei]
MNDYLKKEIEGILMKEVNPHFILIFGSFSKGNARTDSDIDIAYLAEKQLSAYDRFLVAGQLAEALKREVDLVDIRQIDTVFAAQIFSSGEVVSCANEDLFIKERMKALSMYVQLNEYRADLLQQIDERGQIYEK